MKVVNGINYTKGRYIKLQQQLFQSSKVIELQTKVRRPSKIIQKIHIYVSEDQKLSPHKYLRKFL